MEEKNSMDTENEVLGLGPGVNQQQPVALQSPVFKGQMSMGKEL
jgi:hypothetical protein